MKTIKGPAIFIAQFIGDSAPFNSLDGICKWAADLGYKGLQLPTLDPRFIDLQKAAESKTYAEDLKDKIKSYGLEITELSTHLQGQLVGIVCGHESGVCFGSAVQASGDCCGSDRGFNLGATAATLRF